VLTSWKTGRSCAGRPAGLAAPRAGHRAALASVLAGFHQLEARATGSPSHLTPGNASRRVGARAAPYRRRAPSGPSPVPAHASQGWPPYYGVHAGSLLRGEEKEPPCYKGCSRPFLGHACRRPACAPHRGALFSGRSPQAHPFRSRPSPIGTHRAALGMSQVGSSPEQSPPQPCSQYATDRPATGAPPPICGHKLTVGEPLVLSHPFPGQGRHRSRPIPASRAALHAQGLHCMSLILSRVFFVNQGPVCNRNESSRGLSVKLNLKW
jgi:hypothetical protein